MRIGILQFESVRQQAMRNHVRPCRSGDDCVELIVSQSVPVFPREVFHGLLRGYHAHARHEDYSLFGYGRGQADAIDSIGVSQEAIIAYSSLVDTSTAERASAGPKFSTVFASSVESVSIFSTQLWKLSDISCSFFVLVTRVR